MGAASLMLAAGVPMKVGQETLGHSCSTITADTYSSVYPTVAGEAAEAAAALVLGQPSPGLPSTHRAHTLKQQGPVARRTPGHVVCREGIEPPTR